MNYLATRNGAVVWVEPDPTFKGRFRFWFAWSDGSQDCRDTAVFNSSMTLRRAKENAMGRLLYKTGYFSLPPESRGPRPRFEMVP